MPVKALASVAAAAAAIAVTAGFAAAAEAPTCSAECITEYAGPIPPVYNGPFGLARGLGNDIWFGDQDTISRIDTSGAVTSYTTSPGAAVGWVARGDGVMWFTERNTDKIGSVDNLGDVTEYTIPTPSSTPQAVVVDTDGGVWFTEQSGNKIGRLDPTNGSFVEYPVPTPGSAPLGLALGPDGALWFVERNAAKIGRMTRDGSFTEYALTPGSSPQRITVGQDGALWFTELAGNAIGRITTAGALTQYTVPGGPVGITTTPTDSALYVVLFNASAVARVSLDGNVTNEWPTPSPSSAPLQITAGSGHELWFSESFLSPTGNKIGRLELDGR
jgi:virginiamycin B lyase